MKSKLCHIYDTLSVNILLILCCALNAAAEVPSNALIKDPSWLLSNAKNDACNYESLLDADPDTKFYSDTSVTGEQHYIQVTFSDGITMADGENMYVVVTRTKRIDENVPTSWNPTAMEIHYSFDESGDFCKDGEGKELILARVYFINRGSGTTELSEGLNKEQLEERINSQTGVNDGLSKIRRLKFVVTANNGRVILPKPDSDTNNNEVDVRPMILGGFQLYTAMPGEPVVGQWIDRFHLKSDILHDYDDYEFEYTLGALDNRNRETFTGLSKLYDVETGKRTPEVEKFFQELGVDIDNVMPDFSWVTHENDSLRSADSDIKLQPTATIEHLLYAIQGEPIALYPFYTLPATTGYKENFIHWYDYSTGLHVTDGTHAELLNFVGDPSHVFHSNKYGWYTSPLFKVAEIENLVSITTETEYLDFVKKVNGGNTKLSAVLETDLDFKGYTVECIGTSSNPWCGVFLGKNHTIKNLNISSSNQGVGMFGVTGNGAVVANLILDSSCNILGKQSEGTATSDNSGVDVGVVGLHTNGNLSIIGVINQATITGKRNAGGFIGAVNSPWTSDSKIIVENCIFNGVLKGPKGESDNVQNGMVIGWMRGPYYIYLTNIIIANDKSSGFASRKICRHETSYYDSRMHIANCYDVRTYGDSDAQKFETFENEAFGQQDYITLLSKADDKGEWTVSSDSGFPFPIPPVHEEQIAEKTIVYPDRKYGTYATFFHPRDPFGGSSVKGADNMRPLCQDEFVIAADIAENFRLSSNVIAPSVDKDGNEVKGKIVEPIIQFRHIFRVKDGYTFANKYMSDKNGNDTFIQENRRHISATANTDFQIRLDHPYPVEKTTRGVFYYKIDSTDYRRICSRIIRVLDEDENVLQNRKVCQMFVMDEKGQLVYENGSPKLNPDGTLVKINGEIKSVDSNAVGMVDDDKLLFYPTGVFDGQGGRNVDGTDYYICGGGGHFFRMLYCNASTASLKNGKQRTYKVQVIGTDYDNNTIYLADSPDTELKVQEFVITFLPEEASMMVTESELEHLMETRDDLADIVNDVKEWESKIDFDEYAKLEPANLAKLGNTVFKSSYFIVHSPSDKVPVSEGQSIPSGTDAYNYFRWPQPWTRSNYGFGYSARGDYAMQMIVDNQAVTPNHSFGTLQDSSVPHKNGLLPNQLINNYGEGPGLFDRLFYSSRKKGDEALYDRGYFYYVNAADDPGIIARLTAKDLCPGAKITVTCWLAEFTSSPESANVSFNFVARLRSGKRVPMHAHVTGYVGQDNPTSNPRRNQWLFVYTSFVPLLTDKTIPDNDPIDHYEIEIDNNAINSNGADYAIDDIRVYVDRPDIKAEQLNPLCNKENVNIRISSDFGQLLENLNIKEASSHDEKETVDLYYAIFDRWKFEEASIAEKSYEDIFNESVVSIVQKDENGSEVYKDFGYMTLDTYLENNPVYSAENQNILGGCAYWWIDNGINKIVFNAMPSDGNMIPGREYIFSILTKAGNGIKIFGGENGVPSAADWVSEGVQNACAKKCYLTVQGSSVIKIDGAVQQPENEIDACRNQRPVVQIDLYAQKIDDNGNQIIGDDGKPVFELVDRNALFDWFDGTMEEFVAVKEGNITLWDALGEFRDLYPDCDNVVTADVTTTFTQEMKDILVKYSSVDSYGKDNPKLILSQSSYIFPALYLPENVKQIEKTVLAIPVPVEVNKNQLLCSQPTEVNVVVRQRAPYMAHGFPGMPYPDAISNAALRISFDRMNMASSAGIDDNSLKPLVLPYREIVPVTPDVTDMNKFSGDYDVAPVFLAATNDPDYKDLFPEDMYDNNLDEIYSKDNGDLWLIGEVMELKATKGDEEHSSVKVRFNDDMNFREGYWYSMRYLFEEDSEALMVSGNSESSEDSDESDDPESEEKQFACTGHAVFTVKIVPKYQKWTGVANTLSGESFNVNWNNDDNWRRVSKADIMLEGELGASKAQLADKVESFKDYIYDEADGGRRVFSYAPLYFTNTVIPSGYNVPEMFDPKSTIIEYQGEELQWDYDPSGLDIVEVATAESSGNGGVGLATPLVEYDMIENVKTKDDATYCRPWVANRCDQIHFEHGSEIGCQQYLKYNKAWVDMEIDPQRWYTLSSPLQSVVAGDMYLPSDSARQDTPYFEDINFTTSHYNRFMPAVFQRSWNQASAWVYNFDKDNPDNADNKTSAIVKTTWSHVFNDVREQYSTGHGFSIKADLYKLPEDIRPHKVKFRLPKADRKFDYFTEDGQVGNHDTSVDDLKVNDHKLNPVDGSMTITAATDENKLFLVGNPFMAHLDMIKFLKYNKEVISPKYWILEASRQGAAVMSAVEEFNFNTNIDNAEYIAPLQGFFVEVLDGKEGRTLTLNYTSDMAATINDINAGDVNADDVLLKMPSRAKEIPGNCLKISAVGSGSSALLVLDSNACSMYDFNEDAMFVEDPSLETSALVYTVTDDGIATTVNVLPCIVSTEIGVVADNDKITSLLFEGVDDSLGLKLYDVADGSYTDIYDGFSVTVEGQAAHRLYLVSGFESEVDSQLKIEVCRNDVMVYSPVGGLNVNVFDVSGRLLDFDANGRNEVKFTLPSGIYIIEAADNVSNKTKKVYVR